jgi:hypothetical protein
MRLRWLVTVVTFTAFLGAVAVASARITASTVTVSSPTGTYLLDDQVTPAEAVRGGGTATGKGNVDVNCYYGGTFATLAAGVPVTGGSFSFSGSLATMAAHTCVLRAVATGDSSAYPPGSAAPYAGPTVAIDRIADVPPSGVPLRSYDLYASQMAGAFRYGSLGNCSILGSFTYDPVTFAPAGLDACDGGFGAANGATGTPGFAAPTRSELQVDGADAYLPGNAGFEGHPGFPALAYSYSLDLQTGNLVLDETDQVVRCSSPGYPPTPVSCAAYVRTGVQVRVHIVQADAGRMATVVQYFSSTDGRAHNIDLLEGNQFSSPSADGELSFPWTGTGFAPYTVLGEAIPGPAAPGPGSFLVKGSASVPDGSELAPQGAVTFSTPPDSLAIVGSTDNVSARSWVELHYTRTVPAQGPLALGFTYSDAFLGGEVASDAADAEVGFRPSVTITSPHGEPRVSRRLITVTGTATDANGLRSLTVDGRPVVVSPSGTWSTMVTISHSTTAISATATNVLGNRRRAQTAVLYIPPPAISSLEQAHRRWREPGRPASGRPPVGTSFSFTLNEAADLRLAFSRQAIGRRVAGACVAPAPRNRRRRPCKRWVRGGALGASGHGGANTIPFRGTLGDHRRLAPGQYTLILTAILPGTGASVTRRLTFTIVG